MKNIVEIFVDMSKFIHAESKKVFYKMSVHFAASPSSPIFQKPLELF